MSFSNIYFILHKPQLSENIGACARALKNFNFKNLILINSKVSYPSNIPYKFLCVHKINKPLLKYNYYMM